jgi:hypothetical protein
MSTMGGPTTSAISLWVRPMSVPSLQTSRRCETASAGCSGTDRGAPNMPRSNPRVPAARPSAARTGRMGFWHSVLQTSPPETFSGVSISSGFSASAPTRTLRSAAARVTIDVAGDAASNGCPHCPQKFTKSEMAEPQFVQDIETSGGTISVELSRVSQGGD